MAVLVWLEALELSVLLLDPRFPEAEEELVFEDPFLPEPFLEDPFLPEEPFLEDPFFPEEDDVFDLPPFLLFFLVLFLWELVWKLLLFNPLLELLVAVAALRVTVTVLTFATRQESAAAGAA